MTTPLEFFDALYRNADGYLAVSGKARNGSGLKWEDGLKVV